MTTNVGIPTMVDFSTLTYKELQDTAKLHNKTHKGTKHNNIRLNQKKADLIESLESKQSWQKFRDKPMTQSHKNWELLIDEMIQARSDLIDIEDEKIYRAMSFPGYPNPPTYTNASIVKLKERLDWLNNALDELAKGSL